MKVPKAKPTLLFALAAALMGLVACYTVPETGRSAVNLMPEGQLNSMATAQFQQMKKQEKVSHDPEMNAAVQRVGKRIVQSARSYGADLPPANEWEFVVFDAPDTVNAFAMPGGKVGVYSGMFDITKTDDELAVVIGHEIAHVVANHGNERVSHQMIASFGGIAAAQAMNEEDPRLQQAVLTAYGVGSQLGVLKYSRTHESEADHIGLLYMARAGYDPRVAPKFWQAMAAKGGGGAPLEFLSTHPSHETRISDLNSWMPEAVAEYRKATGKS